MASYRGHLTFSSLLAAGYGTVGVWQFDLDWATVFLGAGLTALGGLAPDLDSDSSVPVRELFSLAGVVAPVLAFQRLENSGFSTEQVLVILGGIYLVVRYVMAFLFKTLTVHRGMFHSLPAMLISGLLVFLLYHNPRVVVRLYLAGGMMLGFLSHLVLDEIYAVSFMGFKLTPNKYAGSALKFFSPSWVATLTTYFVLGLLGYLAWLDLG